MTYPQQFEIFWKVYPHRKNKKRAFLAWKKLQPDELLKCKIYTAITAQFGEHEAFASAGLWHADWPLAASWLNDERWDDEIELPAVVKSVKANPLPNFFDHNCYKCGLPARHKSVGYYGDSHYCIKHIPPKALERYREQGYTKDDGSKL